MIDIEDMIAYAYRKSKRLRRKFRVYAYAHSKEHGWSWTIGEHPCPACNSPRDMGQHASRFVREVTGTIQYCKKHQRWADIMNNQWADHLIARDSRQPYKFP